MLFLKLFAVLVTSVIAFIQALDKEKKVKFWLIFFVVFLFGTTMALEFITSQEKKNQDEKLDQLLTTNKKLNVGVTALQEKLDPFIKKAEKRYPDLTKEEALKKFQTDIERIETRAKILEEKATESKSQISDLQKITQKQKEQLSNYSTYAEVATWNFRGGKVVG
jgi:peptidoglycan hydrolase CwlO-like protein